MNRLEPERHFVFGSIQKTRWVYSTKESKSAVAETDLIRRVKYLFIVTFTHLMIE